MRGKAAIGLLACLLLTALAVPPAHAYRALLTGYAQEREEFIEIDPLELPAGQVEGACGLAIGSGTLYVSDYHHRQVHLVSAAGGPLGAAIPVPVPKPEGPCGLARDAAGNLYVNVWHESVLRLAPSPPVVIEAGAGTSRPSGIAVDAGDAGASDVYVSDRTHVYRYAAPVEPGEPPAETIGLGSLGDAYGLAVFEDRVYVADAEDDAVKAFEPAVDPVNPAFTIDGPGFERPSFNSLQDAGLAVDPTNGNLLVADNTQPGFERPVAAIYEFDSAGAFLSRLPSCTEPPKNGCIAASGPIHGEPSGLAVDPLTGNLFVTTGKGERSNVFAYGPYTASAPLAPPPGGEALGPPPAGSGTGAAAQAGSAAAPPRGDASASVVVQRRGVRVSFDGELTPRALPRHGTAPVGISVDARITATNGGEPPQLLRIAIAINRNGRFTTDGLPVCRERDIQPSTTTDAIAACGNSLVGEGHFAANVKLPEQSPFPSQGKILAFNGRVSGKPAILAHIYGTKPAPTSYVLPFRIRDSQGTYGNVLETSLPQATGDWGYVTGLRMKLKRRFTYRGKARSYLSAGCPAPDGFPSAVFPLARTSFAFAGGTTVTSVLSRSCRAKG